MSRRSKEERQQEIGQVALRIIGMQGFHKLTTSTLSQEVGLAEGTIFRHFQNKDEIILAAVQELEKLLFQEASSEDPNPLRRLRDFVLFRLQVLREHPEVRDILFNELLGRTSTEEWGQHISSILKRSLDFVKACLEEAQEKGIVASDVPTAMLVWIVTGVMKGASGGAPHHLEKEGMSRMTPKQVWTTLELLLRRTL